MRWLVLVLFLVASSCVEAQFPTTGILDNFDRANETPVSGDWSNGITGAGSCNIAGNELVQGATGSCWWSASSFDENQELFMTFPSC